MQPAESQRDGGGSGQAVALRPGSFIFNDKRVAFIFVLPEYALVRVATYRFRRVVRGKINFPPGCRIGTFPEGTDLTQLAYEYFRRHDCDVRHLELGFRAISNGAGGIFGPIEVMPDTSEPYGGSDFDEQWSILLAKLKPGDGVFVRDTRHFASTFIAGLEGGSWSHFVQHLDGGYIAEARPGGGGLGHITAYRHPAIRIGVYRSVLTKDEEKMRRILLLQLHSRNWARQGYNYAGASYAGISAVCRYLTTRATLGAVDFPWLPRHTPPNGMIWAGTFEPVHVI